MQSLRLLARSTSAASIRAHRKQVRSFGFTCPTSPLNSAHGCTNRISAPAALDFASVRSYGSLATRCFLTDTLYSFAWQIAPQASPSPSLHFARHLLGISVSHITGCNSRDPYRLLMIVIEKQCRAIIMKVDIGSTRWGPIGSNCGRSTPRPFPIIPLTLAL